MIGSKINRTTSSILALNTNGTIIKPAVLKILRAYWWRLPESNWGHTDFQSVALPTELKRQPFKGFNITTFSISVKKNVRQNPAN